jgi:pSer/pThr/pTyr-binding forkhead associated (FHA) protein
MAVKDLITKKNSNSLKRIEYSHRLICLNGENKSLNYELDEVRLVLGRGEKCDIQVKDVKSSRQHAELKKIGSNYFVTDLGSHNGIYVNEKKVTQVKLTDGDKLLIGSTVYKYSLAKSEDQALKLITEEDDSNFTEDEVVIKKKPNNVRKILILLIIVAGVLSIPTKKVQRKVKRKASLNVTDDTFTELLNKRMGTEDKETTAKVASLIHAGQREYRELNYFRAMNEFRLALVISPNNARASYYLNKTKQALDNEIDGHFIKAKQDIDSLKYSSALIAYCTVIKILKDYPDDERYKDAEANLEIIELKMGKDKGEIKCF